MRVVTPAHAAPEQTFENAWYAWSPQRQRFFATNPDADPGANFKDVFPDPVWWTWPQTGPVGACLSLQVLRDLLLYGIYLGFQINVLACYSVYVCVSFSFPVLSVRHLPHSACYWSSVGAHIIMSIAVAPDSRVSGYKIHLSGSNCEQRLQVQGATNSHAANELAGVAAPHALQRLRLYGIEADFFPLTVATLAGLRMLEVICSRVQCLPASLGNMKGLTELTLWKCEQLQALPDSLGELTGLSELSLPECRALQTLPDSLGELTCLSQLSLPDCTALQTLPDSLGELTGLIELGLPACRALSALPDSLGELTGLTGLNLRTCEQLQALPESFGKLKGLSELDLSCCSALQALPASLGELTGLLQLALRGCEHLQELPESLGELVSLIELDLGGCKRLRTLPASLLKLPAACSLSVAGNCGVRLEYRCRRSTTRTVGQLQDAYKRKVMVQRAVATLLGDRDARRQSLDNLSIVAVLLATSAFVAFAQAPNLADVFPSTSGKAGNTELWLRCFFVADQLAFALSMTVVVLVLVSSGPQCDDEVDEVQAGRVWVNFAGLSLLLFGAVASGILAFVFAAHAVYPARLVHSDVNPVSLLGLCLVLVAARNWYVVVARMFPGREVLKLYLTSWWAVNVRFQPRRVKEPARGSDELAAQALEQAQAQSAVMHAMLAQMKESGTREETARQAVAAREEVFQVEAAARDEAQSVAMQAMLAHLKEASAREEVAREAAAARDEAQREATQALLALVQHGTARQEAVG